MWRDCAYNYGMSPLQTKRNHIANFSDLFNLSYLPFLNAFNIGTYIDEKELSSDWLIDEGTTMDTNICIYNTVIHSVYQLMKKN